MHDFRIEHHYHQHAAGEPDSDFAARFSALEAHMSALTEANAALTQAVDNLSTRIGSYPQQLAAVTEALAAERAEADRLATAEALEDVNQDAAYAEARATTDAAMSEATTVAGQLGVETNRINALVPSEAPVDPVAPVEIDPVTGLPVEPAVDPETGIPLSR